MALVSNRVDGHLTPEWHVPSSQMPPDVTVMSFKNGDGSPRVISMGQGGASDRWVLRPVPNDPDRFYWAPLP